MKALYRNIAQILRNRKIRRVFSGVISVVSAVIVFFTTYATVLPAITMEKTASCGIEEHQHSDSCYEERLICGQEESEGHQHDDSCYTVTKELVCQVEEHKHSKENGCYDEEGNLICKLPEHVHDDSCYKEVKTLTCGLEESEGHHHTDACYEKVLVCGKEVHTHSTECYKNGEDTENADGKEPAADDSVTKSEDSASGSSNAMANDSAEGTSGEEIAAGNADDANNDINGAAATAEEAAPENYVPELDPVDMEAMFGKHTGFYYYHPEEGEELPDSSSDITDWQEVKDDTVLAPEDIVRMYLPYTIPAGSINETNPTAKYRLPENIHLTDRQIDAINKNKNGVYKDYKDSNEDADKYLGAEAIEGNRRPDEELNDGEEEYISAIVRVKESSGGKQELIFTFVPYSIEKNQTTYDADKEPVSAGKKITGWFACDFAMDQIDWVEEETHQETVSDKAADEENDQEPVSDTAADEEAGQEPASDNVTDADTAEKKTITIVEKTAEVIFAEEDRDKDIEEISSTLHLEEKTEETNVVNDAEQEPSEEPAADAQAFKEGTLTAEGDGYKITMDYTAEAQIPENAKLSVREITAETDKEAYENCLAQAKQHMADSGKEKPAVDTYASRFFDIEILTDNGKIEPAAPVNVNIQILDVPAALSEDEKQSDPTVLHFGDNGVEQIDSTTSEAPAEDKADAASDADKDANADSNAASGGSDATEVRFEAESFSVYGVVYNLTKTVITAKGETYEITVTYDENANIPDGAELNVREIEEDSDEYLKVLGGAWSKINEKYLEREQKNINGEELEPLDDPLYVKNILQACFFDITFMYKGQEIEPTAPVNVDIRLVNGLNNADDATATVLHFKEDGAQSTGDTENKKNTEANGNSENAGNGSALDQIEKIENVKTKETSEKVTDFRFQQDSFSVDGFLTSVEANKTVQTPMKLAASGTSDELAPPQINKKKTPNNDGTYDVSLSVTGSAKSSEEVKKANVIIIMDESSSMRYGKLTKVGTATDGTPDFTLDPNVKYYYHQSNGSSGGMNGSALTPADGKLYISGIWSLQPYTGDVYTFKNRLDYEQEALGGMVDALLSNNSPGQTADGTSLEDVIEIAVVGFNSRSYDLCGWSHEKSEIMAGIDRDDVLSDQTHWWDALNRASELASQKLEDEPEQDIHVLFMTDGRPLEITLYYPFTPEQYDSKCVPAVKRLMQLDDNMNPGDKIHLYNIYTYGELIDADNGADNPGDTNGRYPEKQRLSDLTDVASQYGDASYHDANTIEDLQNTLNSILSRINKSVSYGRVSMTDNLPDMTSTALVNGKAGNFRYEVTEAGGTKATASKTDAGKVSITFSDGTTDIVDQASYNASDKKVTWSLGDDYQLRDGCTYTVSFTVWPGQMTYDILADLRNGLLTWGQPYKYKDSNGTEKTITFEEYSAQIENKENSYFLKTNEDTGNKVDYYTVNSETVKTLPDGVTVGQEVEDPDTKEITKYTLNPDGITYTKTVMTPGSQDFVNPDPMPLAVDEMALKKIWDDNLDESQKDELLWEDVNGDGVISDDEKTAAHSKEYGIHLKVWKADTESGLSSLISSGTGNYGNAIPLGWDADASSYDWEDKLTVAPGTMILKANAENYSIDIDESKVVKYDYDGDGTEEEYYIIESGHYYTLTEEPLDYHFELKTLVYHPMLVNGELCNVTFNSDESVKDIVPMSTVEAINTLKGGINITKEIVDQAGNVIETNDITTNFTVHGSITKVVNGTAVGTELQYRLIGDEYTDDDGNSGRSPKVTIADSSDFEITLHAGDYIRIVNVPSGYSYSFYEKDLEADNPYSFYSIEGSAKNKADEDVSGANISVSEDGKTLKGTTVPNAAQNVEVKNKQPETASLKIKKIVTYNGLVPCNESQKTKMAGTYTFTIYKDEACTIPYQETSGTNKTVSITIGNDGVAVTSEEITGIPVGDYWIKETNPENGSSPVVNPVKATVEAGKTGEAAPVVSVTNNYADGPDQAFITVKKTFSGIKKEEIPDNFSITITDGTNTYTLTNKSEGSVVFSESADGLTWSWKILNVPTGTTYSISESNENINGYTVTTTGTGESQTIPEADIELNVIGEVNTHNSQKVWPVNTNTIFVCSLTSAHGGTGGILVVSKESLSMSVRKAVEKWSLKLTPGSWKRPFYYYSVDEHPNGFQVNGGTVTCDTDAGTVTFTDTSIWMQNASVSVIYNEPESADFNITNDYTSVPVDLDVIKIDQDDNTKKLSGAVFTLRQLDPEQTGARTLSGSTDKTSTSTDANGKTSFAQLTSGYYEIKETLAPDGYIISEDAKFYIKVYAGAVTFITYDESKKPTEWATAENTSKITFELAKAADPDAGTAAQNATATVKNEPGSALPSTGGPGTYLFTILGSMLIAFAGAMLLRRRQTH